MAEIIHIASEAQLAEIIAAADSPLEVVGRATKRGFGRPVAAVQS